MTVGRADDGIHLPVADLVAQLDHRGSLGDVTLAGKTTALFGAGMTFSPLRRLPEEPKQLAASLLVSANESVDRLVADLESSFEPQAATDLVGTEAFT